MSGDGFWAGIDAGANKSAICVKDGRGDIIDEVEVPSNAEAVSSYLSSLALSGRLVVGIEAGDTAVHVTRGLREQGFVVRVLETRFANGLLQVTQNKTDRNDARGLADVVRLMGRARSVLVKSAEAQTLQSELVLRHQLVGQRVAIENAIKGVFRLNGVQIPRLSSAKNLDLVVKAELKKLKQTGIDLSAAIGPALKIAYSLRKTIELGERRLDRVAKADHVCRRLMTVPGVGTLCALAFYASVDDPYRFEDNRDVAPYLGLVPRISQSGAKVRRGRISKRGSVLTRTHLVTSAKSMLGQSKVDCAAKRWALALRERAGPKKAQVALAKKLAIIMLAIWKSGTDFEPAR